MRDERGMALVEAVLLTIVLLVPLLWMLSTLSGVQRAALAASSAAREAGQEMARASDVAEARSRALAAVRMAFANHGLDASRVEVRLSPGSVARGSLVRVRVTYEMPVIGSFATGPVVPVSAEHDAVVDPYRSR